jgi:hypothetical protein
MYKDNSPRTLDGGFLTKVTDFLEPPPVKLPKVIRPLVDNNLLLGKGRLSADRTKGCVCGMGREDTNHRVFRIVEPAGTSARTMLSFDGVE